MAILNLHIVTPDQVIYDDAVIRVRACGEDGFFSILPRHAPMISSLRECEIEIEDKENKIFYVMIDAGVLETSKNQINILSQTAMLADESNVAAVKMEYEKHHRIEQNIENRDKMLKSELELRRLLHQVSDYDSRR